ncbi:MAG: NAD(P)/FAD-dependent oxidoreductase [Bacteroidia bacterium]
MQLFDVIIIGGGPSGSTCASFLSQKGMKVLILEKEKFPREHIGESLIPASYDVLKKLGVIEELKRISPRKPGVNFISNDGKSQSLWCFKSIIKNRSYLSFHVKRSLFDEMLLNNSRVKGATVLEEHAVKNMDLNRPDGGVEVMAITKEGESKSFTAKFLVDASGQNTFLGTKMGVKKTFSGLDRVALWSHWTGANFDIPLQQGAIKIVYLNGKDKLGWFWVIPISKDNLSIGAVINNAFMRQEKARFSDTADWKEAIYMNEISESEPMREMLRGAKMDHKVQVNGDYSYFCEKKYGSNYAMIGDAGAFLDPIFSSGIFVGMHSAELVADALYEKIIKNNALSLDEVYKKINGAVMLLEKFIKLFYTPDNINFAEMGDPTKQINRSESEGMYSIFHYLLAGDFFTHYQKYSDFIDTIQDPKMLSHFQNLIRHQKYYDHGASCGESPSEMYDEMTEKIEFDLAAFG